MTAIRPISSPQPYETSPSLNSFFLDPKLQATPSIPATSVSILIVDPLNLFDQPFPSVHKTGSSHFPASKPAPIPRRRSIIAPPLISPAETTGKLTPAASPLPRGSSSSFLSVPSFNSPNSRSTVLSPLSLLKSTNPAIKQTSNESTITFSVSKDQSFLPLSSSSSSSIYANYLKFNEEKALRNWQRHYATWKQTEESLSSRIQKVLKSKNSN